MVEEPLTSTGKPKRARSIPMDSHQFTSSVSSVSSSNSRHYCTNQVRRKHRKAPGAKPFSKPSQGLFYEAVVGL